jgi:predicted metal-binding protein
VTATDQTNIAASQDARGDAAVIYVCITCVRAAGIEQAEEASERPGALLAAATARAAEGLPVSVRPVRCLANCSRGTSAAIRCNGSWTYVFGGLDVGCGAALVAAAQLLAGAADGIMPWRGRPEVLKKGIVARIPPLDFSEMDFQEDVR